MTFHRTLTLWVFATCALFGGLSTAHCEGSELRARYAREQAMVKRLSDSTVAKDKISLGDLFDKGILASPDNPLRVVDHTKSFRAFQAGFDLGDRTPATIVSLARQSLRVPDGKMINLLPMLRSLVVDGNGDAAYVLALIYAKDPNQTTQTRNALLASAATLGNASAILDLAGAGVHIGDTALGVALDGMRRRASNKSGPASFALFKLFYEGQAVPRDTRQALSWLQQAVDARNIPATVRQAELYQHGIDMPANPVKAAELFRRAANAGSADAAVELGRAAALGSAMQIPLPEGRLWLRRAIKVGVNGADVDLAHLDIMWALRSRDESERTRLVQAALVPIIGNTANLTELAKRNWETADVAIVGPVLLPLLQSAALSGSTEAGLAFDAWLRTNGQALPYDVAVELVKNLRKMSAAKVGFATYTLADLALDGRIGEDLLSKQQAVRILFDAAQQKVGQAMLRIAEMYSTGDVLAQNRQFAERWYKQAEGQQVERASLELASMRMTGEDAESLLKGKNFFLQKIDAGDFQAALALVRIQLRLGDLDQIILSRAAALASTPADHISLAGALQATGRRELTAKAIRLLLPYVGIEPEPNALVTYGRALINSTSDYDTALGFDVLRRAVAQGTVNAKITLAAAYFRSTIYKNRRIEANALLDSVLSANPHNPEALILKSKAYLLGLGIERDAVKAEALLADVRAGGEIDNPKATLLEAEGLSFLQSRHDPQAAIAMLKSQARLGSPAAERALGLTNLSGFDSTIDPDAAAGQLLSAAKAGDKEAMAAFGQLLLNGYGVSQSREAGLSWLIRSADAGNTAAMYELSRVYALVPTGSRQPLEVLRWLRLAAEGNNPNAAYQLGLAYLNGDGVNSDREEASIWLRRSANAGSLLASRTLAGMQDQQHPGLHNLSVVKSIHD